MEDVKIKTEKTPKKTHVKINEEKQSLTMSRTAVVVCVAVVEVVVGDLVVSCLAFGLAQYISRW